MAKAANFISCSQSLLSQKLKNGKSKFKWKEFNIEIVDERVETIS
jgi:hypothetical protein